MNWKEYEEEVLHHFLTQYPDAHIRHNVSLPGRYSHVERQIDVLIEGSVAGFQFRIAVDAKHRGRPIDVKDVEAFIGLCDDIGAQKGVLISLNGFTPAATRRAFNDLSDVELDALNFADLKDFQAFGALPYSGSNGVAIEAPFGWVIDGTQRGLGPAALYQRGLKFEDATLAHEWMYVNFWTKDQEASSIEELVALQEGYIRHEYPRSEISYRVGPARTNVTTKIRTVKCSAHPVPEHTGFVEFAEFIFFCVLFTPEELAARNLRKLEHLLRTALPFKIAHKKSEPPLRESNGEFE